MKKIIVCLLLFNVLFFTFIKFTFADVVDLGKLPACGFVDGTTNCKHGSYYYINSVPVPGTKIMSSGRVVRIIYFQGSGYFDLYDKSGNVIDRLDVNSPDRVGIYVLDKGVYSYAYFGVDLIATYFRKDGGNRGLIVAYKPYSKDLHDFLSGGNYFKPEQLPKPDLEPDPEPEVKPGCDICSKIDSILDLIGKIEELIAELKKKDCDVCKKLDAILADTDAMNNNISQLKITTGYINSHVSEIKDKISDNSLILAKIRQTLDIIRMQDIYRNDNLDSIDNKLDNLESIDKNLEGIRDGIDRIADDLTPTITPDFSGQIQKPDLPVLDIPNLSKQQDTNIYFSEKAFVGESESLPFAPEPKNWTDFNNKSLDLDEFERDEPLEQDEFEREKFERDEPLEQDEFEREKFERDEPLERDEFEREKFERDDPLERDEFEREKFERDDPLERDRPLERDEPLGG